MASCDAREVSPCGDGWRFFFWGVLGAAFGVALGFFFFPFVFPPPEAREQLTQAEASKLIATLTRIFGLDRLRLAEDVVQEALIRALSTWPYHGVPDKPSAWITQTAKNLALWNGWTPKQLAAANAELVEAELVLEAKRERAGRGHFLPGGWEALKAPHTPLLV